MSLIDVILALSMYIKQQLGHIMPSRHDANVNHLHCGVNTNVLTSDIHTNIQYRAYNVLEDIYTNCKCRWLNTCSV